MRLDPVAIVRRQPLLLVGAGVAVVAGFQLLRGSGAEPGEDAAAAEEPTAPGAGGLLGGGLGSIASPISYPTNGELVDSGVVSQPAPAPVPTTPTTKTAYLVATVKAGTYDMYDVSKTPSGKVCTRNIGTYKTGGYTAEVRDLGTSLHCNDTRKTRRTLLVLTGTHTGKVINRSTATVVTKYR